MRRKQNVRQTSLEAYRELEDLGRRQQTVYEGIKMYPNITAVELARKLGRLDPNYVRPRIYELVKMGIVLECEKRQCSITQKTVYTYKVVT